MTTHGYAIAEEDELEAFGRDTSAALRPGEFPNPAETPPQSRGRRFACVLFFGLALAAGAAGIAFALRTRSPEESASAPDTSASSTAAPSTTDTTLTSAPKAPASAPEPAAPAPAQPAAVTALTPAPEAPVQKYTVEVLESLPHDESAFTQGFEYRDGFFYEGTGLHSASSIRRVEPKTGKVVQRYDYEETALFGEGITLPDDKNILAITWQSGRGFLFDRATLNRTKEWKYQGEGWGLCTDRARNEVYMSDGTAQLRVLDPETEEEKRQVTVTLNGTNVTMLNELEWVCDEVWSNVWQTSLIYRIDPASGRVKSIIDASNLPLADDHYSGMDVLNGIAVDPAGDQLWLTGKKWRKVYRVKTTDSSLDLTKCQ